LTAEARRASVGPAELDPQLLAHAMAASGDASAADYLVRRRMADRAGTAIVLREVAVLLFAQRPLISDNYFCASCCLTSRCGRQE
jgi:phosphopantothenate synthetase